MNKLLELLKRKLYVSKMTTKNDDIYFIDIESHQITEEEYNLIKEFIQRKDEEENGKE
jgi:hypothetical protein